MEKRPREEPTDQDDEVCQFRPPLLPFPTAVPTPLPPPFCQREREEGKEPFRNIDRKYDTTVSREELARPRIQQSERRNRIVQHKVFADVIRRAVLLYSTSFQDRERKGVDAIFMPVQAKEEKVVFRKLSRRDSDPRFMS